MRRALSEYVVTGIRTNLVFHEKLFAHPDFAAGRYDTGFIAEHETELLGDGPSSQDGNALAVALAVSAASRAAREVRVESQPGASASLSPWAASHRARLRKV